jgi:uncharacterized membrane protein YcfT
MQPAASDTPRRLPWVDLAKGLCIIAVVALWTGRQMQWEAGWIVPFERFARPFRMPDFFLLSGLFVGAVLHRPWRSYLDTKVLHFAYFLVLWTLIIVPIAWLGGTQRPATPQAVLGELAVKMFYKPEAMLWFILMLPVFFVVTRLLQKVSPLLVLNAAAVLAMLKLHTGVYPLDWFAKYFVFFYTGHVLSGAVLALAQAAPRKPALAVAALLVWAGLNHLFTASTYAEAGPPLLVAAFVGIAAVVTASSLLAPLAWTAPLRWLGAHSIVVYLGFYVPLMLIIRLVRRFAPQLDASAAATLVWAGSIAAAVALYLLLRRTPLRYLYERPSWARLGAGGGVSRAVQSAPSSSA